MMTTLPHAPSHSPAAPFQHLGHMTSPPSLQPVGDALLWHLSRRDDAQTHAASTHEVERVAKLIGGEPQAQKLRDAALWADVGALKTEHTNLAKLWTSHNVPPFEAHVYASIGVGAAVVEATFKHLSSMERFSQTPNLQYHARSLGSSAWKTAVIGRLEGIVHDNPVYRTLWPSTQPPAPRVQGAPFAFEFVPETPIQFAPPSVATHAPATSALDDLFPELNVPAVPTYYLDHQATVPFAPQPYVAQSFMRAPDFSVGVPIATEQGSGSALIAQRAIQGGSRPAKRRLPTLLPYPRATGL